MAMECLDVFKELKDKCGNTWVNMAPFLQCQVYQISTFLSAVKGLNLLLLKQKTDMC